MLWTELKYRLRNLLRTPLFVMVACLSLAVGFGLNALVCAAFKNIVLRPLPFKEPDRLMTIWEANPSVGIPQISVSLGNFADLKRLSSFEVVTAFFPRAIVLTVEERQEEIQGVTVSSEISAISGVHPQIGRDFLQSDFSLNAPLVAIISHDLWQNWMQQNGEMIGRTIDVDRQPYIVVGVMPPGFSFPYPIAQNPVQIWFPDRSNAAAAPRKFHGGYVIGKLTTQATRNNAMAEVETLAQRLASTFPSTNRNWSFRVIPLHEVLVRDSRQLLLLLFMSSMLLLIIASTNNSIMWLSRHLLDFEHLTVKISLGAPREILIRSLMLESIVLAIMGALIGLVFNRLAQPILMQFFMRKGWITDATSLSADTEVLIAIFSLSLLIGAVSGIVPAWVSVQAAAKQSMPQNSSLLYGQKRSSKIHGALACLETALATMVLLLATTLLVDYHSAVTHGFGRRTDQVIAAKIKPNDAKYGPLQQRINFHTTLLEHVKNLPAVESAAIVSGTSLSAGLTLRVSRQGMPAGDQSREEADLYIVSPSYFQTIGARVAQGRDFTETDGTDGMPIVIISEALSHQLWHGENPIGQELLLDNSGGTPHTVIGVVHDIDHFAFSKRHVNDLYVPFRQRPWIQMWLLVNSPARGKNLFLDLQRTAWDIDSETSVTSFSTFHQLQERELSAPQARTILLTTLAALALALTILGVYGVIAYQGTQRSREIALRIAIGATRTDILFMFLKQSSLIAAGGIAVGVLIAIGANRLVNSLLLVKDTNSIGSTVLTAIFVFCVVLGASFFPAMQASWRDPVSALKNV